MKHTVLALTVLLPFLATAKEDGGRTEIRAAIPQVRPVSRYQDLLAVIPRDMEPQNARNWTQADREVANKILKHKLIDTNRPASFRFRIQGIDAWPGVTVWAQLPADEGYPIRLFAGRWKEQHYLAKVATLKPGDYVEMNGVLDEVRFHNLWNTESLTIGLREASFTKLDTKGKPVATVASKTPIKVISAVYGSGDRFADVTERVHAFVHEPGAVFAAKPHWLEADPTVGWNKALIIVYELHGKRKLFSCGEGGEVSAMTLLAN